MQVLNSSTGYRSFLAKPKWNKTKQNKTQLHRKHIVPLKFSPFTHCQSQILFVHLPLNKIYTQIRRYWNPKNGIHQLQYLWVRPIHNAFSFCYFTAFPKEYRVVGFFSFSEKERILLWTEDMWEKDNHYNILSKVFLPLLNKKVTVVGLSKQNLRY